MKSLYSAPHKNDFLSIKTSFNFVISTLFQFYNLDLNYELGSNWETLYKMKINRKTTEILNHSVDIYNSIIELKYKDAFHLIRNNQTLANTDMSVFPSVYGKFDLIFNNAY